MVIAAAMPDGMDQQSCGKVGKTYPGYKLCGNHAHKVSARRRKKRSSGPIMGEECFLPRFHFNVHDGSSLPDETGTEIADLNLAKSEAVRFAGSVLRENCQTFWANGHWSLDVTDEFGLVLFALVFAAFDAPAVAVG